MMIKKYDEFIIHYNASEDIIHYTKIKDYVFDLIDNWYTIIDFDGFFHIPWKYTMCPVNLIQSLPLGYEKKGNILI